MSYLLPILVAASLGQLSYEEFFEIFDEHSYRYTGGTYQNEPFWYQLHVPEPLKSGKKYPLIVWLHGAGEAQYQGGPATMHVRHLDNLIFTKPEKPHRYPFYLVAMATKRNTGWYSQFGKPPKGKEKDKDKEKAKGEEPVTVLNEILDRLLKEHAIDPDRITLSGLSAGGSGCWEMALRYPDRFAAVAPLASGGGDTSRAEKLRDIPIWAFHCTVDRGTPIGGVRQMVEAVDRAGGNVYLTEINKESHDCWTEAFLDYGLLAWLLDQRRGESTGSSPGSRSLFARVHRFFRETDWVGIVATFGLPIAVAIAGFFLWRRSRKSPTAPPVVSRTRKKSPLVGHSPRLTIVILTALTVGFPAAYWMATGEPATLSANGVIIGDGNLVILEPEKWAGQPLPVQSHIDIGDRLAKGDWTLLFYHHDCPECQETIRRFRQDAGAGLVESRRVALIEIPPYGELPSDLFVHGRLSDDRDWFVQTPVVIVLQRGTVTRVVTDMEVLAPHGNPMR